MPKAEEIHSVEAEIVCHSKAAILVKYNGEEIWIPQSQLFDYDELPKTGNARVKMTAWIAKEKGFI